MKPQLYIFLSISLVFLCKCSEYIEYSPYDSDITSYQKNTDNIDQIDVWKKQDTLKFIVFSDTHSYYDDFSDAIKSMNQQPNIDFAVCCGDITESGLAQEYEWFHEICKKIQFPVLTVIGNHDYLSNGSRIYKKMFGNPNFSFSMGSYTFIGFDDIVWENNNKPLNFDWLQNQLDSDTSKKYILLTHIPPWTDQLEGDKEAKLNSLITTHNVLMCVHGHLHNHEIKTLGTVPLIVSGSVKYRQYLIISLFNNCYTIEKVVF